MLHTYISEQRKKMGLSQEKMAEVLGISRPTYIQIELGERDVTIPEGQKLADVFGCTFEQFLSQQSNQKEFVIEVETPRRKKISETRISIPQKHIAKFKEVLLYILTRVGSKPNVGETVLYKLLYFIDFDYYEKYEEQLTGATYIKNHFGPTPVEFKTVIQHMEKVGELETVKSIYFQHEQKKYLPRRLPNLSLLSAQEIDHIDKELHRLSDKNAKELSDFSHGDVPWMSRKMGEELSYESVFYRDERYSVRQYDDEL